MSKFPLYELAKKGVSFTAGSDIPALGISKNDALQIEVDKFTEDAPTVWEVKGRLRVGFLYENFGGLSVITEKGDAVELVKGTVKLVGTVTRIIKQPPNFDEFTAKIREWEKDE